MSTRSAAFSLALFLGIAAPAASYAVPVMPIDSIRDALSQTSNLEEARWVRRCHTVRVKRGGQIGRAHV